ncbi:MAG: cold shock domain-containing protein [Methanobrevibacter sp.]|uniref:cold shock domain-containing protein n=1 Tax=Methanobrevibacter sp. TaxID=66852 RepID=UPI0025E43720|nr:cold shock domain-containing protein [Methanobrevibacter sp.]MBE6507896.1 cold shock domain-containing protein [Methanobrevibacter sp.]
MNIRKDLAQANRLVFLRKDIEAIGIYEKYYKENPEVFTKKDRISYAWAIYRTHIKDNKDEYELFDYAEFITEITNQADLSKVSTCPYTFSVFKVMKKLKKENDFFNLVYWIEKIDPDLLGPNKSDSNGTGSNSRKEKYFEYASKTYFGLQDYEECIEVSERALESLSTFTNDGDTWHRWRIAKSLGRLDQNEGALKYLNEVIKVKHDWYIYRELAENHFALGNREEALKNICEAVLAKGPADKKVNLYGLVYSVLKDSEPEIALRHAELYYLLKLENGSRNILEEIENLDIDEDTLEMFNLTAQIKDYWMKFKFKDQELQYGTVTRFFEDKNYGFIRTDDDKSLFFHRKEFKGDTIYVGQLVSFYTEKRFDKSKNSESLNAVNVRGE